MSPTEGTPAAGRHGLLIDGRWRDGRTTFTSVNPAAEEPVAEFAATTRRLARAVAAALAIAAAGCGGSSGPIEPAQVTADQVRETQEAIARAQGAEAAAPREETLPEATDGSR